MNKRSRTDRVAPDVVQDNRAKLRALFPEVFSEGQLDLQALAETLGHHEAGQAERYGLHWHGKGEARRLSQTPSTATLRTCPEASLHWDSSPNLFIEGDNLQVLKMLQKSYSRRVKLIYIDPPYNTGKEYIYPDRWQESRDSYLRETGQLDARGRKHSAEAETDGRYHTRWLNMMYPRLKLARALLREDGFMVVSIDDHELANLTALMDELFGEDNRVATLVWEKNRKNDAALFSVGHDYMLVYARNRGHLRDENVVLRAPKQGVEEVRSLFDALRQKHDDHWPAIQSALQGHFEAMARDDPRRPLARFNRVDAQGPYRDDGNINWPGGGGPRYEVKHPVTKEPCKLPRSGWRYSTPERFWQAVQAGRVIFGPDHQTVPRVRTNLFANATRVMGSVHYSYAQTASNSFDAIFDGTRVFDHPKHFEDLANLVHYLCDDDSLVLDFFAGSGSLGHAVIEANRRHGSRRRYICAQLPEQIQDSTSTGKNALALGMSTIAQICAERLRRIDDGSGFRYFTLSDSPLKPRQAEQQSTDRDLLFQQLLERGLDLASPVQTRSLAGLPVQVLDGGALVLCLAAQIPPEAVAALADLKQERPQQPMQVVLRESCFADDDARDSATRILARAGIDDVSWLQPGPS